MTTYISPADAASERKRRNAYHKDTRIVAARKQYRLDMKNGMPEIQAWAKFQIVQREVKQA